MIAVSERSVEQGAQRRCLVTGRVAEKAALVRFVTGPGGRLVADIGGDLPGRGMWVGAHRELVERACARGHFRKAARAKDLMVEADLADRVESLIAGRCLDLLGLARRAGALVTGYEKSRQWIRRGRAAVVVLAADHVGGVGEKLRWQAKAAGCARVELFTGGELGAALGREEVVGAALGAGRLAERFRAEAERLAGFRTGPAGPVSEPAGTSEDIVAT